MNYWLMKSEPDCFSIDDLQKAPAQTSSWDGVRNYQARNFMRDQMRIGDLVFFYHSNCKPPGIVGVAEIVSEAYPDHTAFDPESEHPDPKSTPEYPRWFMVDLRFQKKFERLISLDELKRHPDLSSMPLLRKGNRLSVLPVSLKEWHTICGLIEK
ncbi:MAG: EVE domain-containing protein [Legionella sp.]|nr:MAG: EVE domain-containing protein [Legionella sp.]